MPDFNIVGLTKFKKSRILIIERSTGISIIFRRPETRESYLTHLLTYLND